MGHSVDVISLFSFAFRHLPIVFVVFCTLLVVLLSDFLVYFLKFVLASLSVCRHSFCSLDLNN